MNIWEAPQEIKEMIAEIKAKFHLHLAQASIWALCSDANHIIDNQLVATATRRCTRTEHMKTKHHFKIEIIANGWHHLTDNQRRIAIDEALCRCGVRYLPSMQTVNKKAVVIKDDLGRTVYTDTIATDGEGIPKWKINKLDAGVYFALLQRHSHYSEGVENIINALEGKPLKRPIITEQAIISDNAEDDGNEDNNAVDGAPSPLLTPFTSETPV